MVHGPEQIYRIENVRNHVGTFLSLMFLVKNVYSFGETNSRLSITYRLNLLYNIQKQVLGTVKGIFSTIHRDCDPKPNLLQDKKENISCIFEEVERR